MSGPGIWNLEKVIEENPLGEEPIKWTYLVEGAHATINVAQLPSANIPHIHHEHDETVYLLKGEGQFRLGDRTYPAKAGDLVFIPAGTVHTPISDSYLAGLSIYSPRFDPGNPDREFVKP
jgi:quercetin dioxygenase-like cupin family protein